VVGAQWLFVSVYYVVYVHKPHLVILCVDRCLQPGGKAILAGRASARRLGSSGSAAASSGSQASILQGCGAAGRFLTLSTVLAQHTWSIGVNS
jgi:hypothetical protein